MATQRQLSSANVYNEIWSCGISLHIRSCHLKEEICHLRVTSHPCSTFQGVYRRFNKTRGNGLFNLASEPGWILWLRIWQFHFHTLRKQWFYTCWLSPCVKRLFHHCQRQMQRTPSCHTEPPQPQRSLIAADKRDRRTSAAFGKVCRLSHDVFIHKILFSHTSTSVSPSYSLSALIPCHRNASDMKESRLPPDPQLETVTHAVIHHVFQGRCTAAGH